MWGHLSGIKKKKSIYSTFLPASIIKWSPTTPSRFLPGNQQVSANSCMLILPSDITESTFTHVCTSTFPYSPRHLQYYFSLQLSLAFHPFLAVGDTQSSYIWERRHNKQIFDANSSKEHKIVVPSQHLPFPPFVILQPSKRSSCIMPL